MTVSLFHTWITSQKVVKYEDELISPLASHHQIKSTQCKYLWQVHNSQILSKPRTEVRLSPLSRKWRRYGCASCEFVSRLTCQKQMETLIVCVFLCTYNRHCSQKASESQGGHRSIFLYRYSFEIVWAFRVRQNNARCVFYLPPTFTDTKYVQKYKRENKKLHEKLFWPHRPTHEMQTIFDAL